MDNGHKINIVGFSEFSCLEPRLLQSIHEFEINQSELVLVKIIE